jgi:hypothetical protein
MRLCGSNSTIVCYAIAAMRLLLQYRAVESRQHTHVQTCSTHHVWRSVVENLSQCTYTFRSAQLACCSLLVPALRIAIFSAFWRTFDESSMQHACSYSSRTISCTHIAQSAMVHAAQGSAAYWGVATLGASTSCSSFSLRELSASKALLLSAH